MRARSSRPSTFQPMSVAVAVTAVAAVAGLAGCSSGGKDGESSGGTSVPSVSIKAGDKTCGISKTTLPAGRHTFSVQNTSSQVTEVYIYAAGDRIVGEVEDVGPATTRSLVVDLPNGSYQVACKPGMAGSGIRTALTVNGVS